MQNSARREGALIGAGVMVVLLAQLTGQVPVGEMPVMHTVPPRIVHGKIIPSRIQWVHTSARPFYIGEARTPAKPLVVRLRDGREAVRWQHVSDEVFTAYPEENLEDVFDHTHTWTPNHRDQGKVGSCYVFTAVALAEAAIYARTGKKLDLSERDLFEQEFVDPATQKKHFDKTLQGESALNAVEGGSARSAFDWLTDKGVCSENTHPYDYDKEFSDIYQAYHSYLRTRQRVAQAMKCRTDPASVMFKNLGFFNEAVDEALKADRDDLLERMSQRAPDCDAERAAVKEMLKGWSLEWRPLGHLKIGDIEKAVLAELEYRPVGLSLEDYSGVRNRRSTATDDHAGHHAVVGAFYDKNSQTVLIRNSWGVGYDILDGSNPIAWGRVRGMYVLRYTPPPPPVPITSPMVPTLRRFPRAATLPTIYR